jgi:WD40 repeat protein
LIALGLPALAVPDPVVLAKKPTPADALKRSDIPAEVLSKMGKESGDAPKEIVAVLGRTDTKHLVISVSLTADGRYLATGGKDEHMAQIFDLQTGQLVKTFRGFAQQIRAVAISPDGKTLAAGIKSATPPLLSLWNIETGALRAAPPEHTNAVMGLDISPDGKLLASAGLDRTARLWDLATGAALGAPIMHNTEVNRVAFSTDGKWLASASGMPQTNGAVIISEVATGRIIARLIGQAGELRGLAWHPNGQALASASKSGTIWIWDLKTMKSSRVLQGNAAQVQAVAWHPSGQFLASNDHAAAAVILWDMRAAEPKSRVIRLFPPGAGDLWTHDVIFTPEGRHLIAANPNGTVSVVRLAERGEEIK